MLETGVEITVPIGYFNFFILKQKKYSNQSKVKYILKNIEFVCFIFYG